MPPLNQCDFGHILTNQGQSALIPSASQELFLLALFGVTTGRVAPAGSEERPLSSHPLLRTFQHVRSLLKIMLLPATHTKEPALRPATQATYYSEHLQTQEPNVLPTTPKSARRKSS